MNSYFPHDSNARNSAKLINVRMKYKAEGYGVYFMILERLRDEEDYMSLKDYNAIAFELRVDASLVRAIVEDFGLFAFTDDGEYFYSEGFNKRMSIKDAKTKRRVEAGKKGAAKRWNKQNNSNAMANPSNSDSNAMANPSNSDSNAMAKPHDIDGKESKVNKTKVNETKQNKNKQELSKTDPGEFLLDFIDFFKEFPNQQKKKDSQEAYEQARMLGTPKDILLKGAIAYRNSLNIPKGKTSGYATTADKWLDSERWTDEYHNVDDTVTASNEPPRTREDWVG